MEPTSDTRSLADFKANASELLDQLRATGRPLVLTVDGQPEVVVQDVRSYRHLIALAERLETIQAVRDGLASIERDEGRPLDEVFDELEDELGG